MKVESLSSRIVLVGAILLAIAAGLLLVSQLRDSGSDQPTVSAGVLLENAGSAGNPILLAPEGERALVIEEARWCVAEMPSLQRLDSDVLAIDSLPLGTLDKRCTDSYAIASPNWSPDGSRLVAQGHETTGESFEFELPKAELLVFDTATLEVETVLTTGPVPVALWVSNSEVLYYPGPSYPDPLWLVTSIEGETRDVAAPSPLPGGAIRVSDSTVVYPSRPADGSVAPGDPEVGRLIALDLATDTVTELAPLKNLNPDGTAPDPGLLTGVSTDLTHAVLLAKVSPNETGLAPRRTAGG